MPPSLPGRGGLSRKVGHGAGSRAGRGTPLREVASALRPPDSLPSDGVDAGGELHLVVIWSAARRQEKAILADLQDHLEVRRVHEVAWSPALVRQNYSRFYRGRLVPPYRNVRLRKGNGPLLVVTAIDQHGVEQARGGASRGQSDLMVAGRR